MMAQRTEKDALGKMVLDASLPRGIYTQRVLDTYPTGVNLAIPEIFLRTYLEAKMVYATVNGRFRIISPEKRNALQKAWKNLLKLQWWAFTDLFPVGQVQSGWWTSTNMMINEVLSNKATLLLWWKYGKYLVDPHDDCNASQSSNDTFPWVTKLVLIQMMEDLLQALYWLEKSVKKLANRWKSIKKVWRTHMQDAVVVTIWNEFGAYVRTLQKNKKYLQDAVKVLLELNFWWTATGSEQNISPAIRKELIREFSKVYKKKFVQPKSYFEQNSSSWDIAWFVQAIHHCVNDLLKIANDVRMLSSGPFAWLHEIDLPAVHPWSSIMPWKVNPSVVEAATMIIAKVHGDVQTVQFLTRQAQLELQQFMPQIAWSAINAVQWLTDALVLMDEQCFQWLKFNKKHIQSLLDHSLAQATDFTQQFGYETVADAVIESLKTWNTLQSILWSKKK